MDQSHKIHPSSPLLNHCPPSLPALAYYDNDWFAKEQEKIWSRSWVYVGRDNDLPPSTMRRISVGGQNLILLKDRGGKAACFLNTCRHRGAELCPVDERPLVSKLIVCPYHQWSYGLDGKLVRTPFVSVTEDFRKDAHSLLSVHLREWNGFLFVSLADEAPDFGLAPDLGPAAFDNWPMRDLVTGHTMVKELSCNWKIFWENYNECLHCPGIHPELIDMVPIYARGYMSPEEAPGWTPESAAKPGLKQGARSWTMNGQPCGHEFPGLTDSERAAGQLFVTLLPTMFVVAHVDYVRAVSLTPLGPERTLLKAEWLFAPRTLASPDFDLNNVVDFAMIVMSQDGAACEMNQRGLRNRKFTNGTLMPQEFDVYRFHEWVRKMLEGANPADVETY